MSLNSNLEKGERQMVGKVDCGIQSKLCPPRRGHLEAGELTVASWWPIQCWEEPTLLSLMADRSQWSSLLLIKTVKPPGNAFTLKMSISWQKKQVPDLFTFYVLVPSPTITPPS